VTEAALLRLLGQRDRALNRVIGLERESEVHPRDALCSLEEGGRITPAAWDSRIVGIGAILWRMKSHFALIVVGIAAVACNGYYSPPHATPSPINTGGPTTSAQPSGTEPGATQAPQPTGPSAEIEIDITDGPHDGSYRAVAPGACRYQPQQNSFSVNYSNNAAPGGFVALDLVLRDAAVAIDDSSDDFDAKISVGGPNGGVSYTIDPRSGEGDGNAFLDVSDQHATLDVEVDARDGAQIVLIVTCGLP
jgi:hypothetical protein